jgi:hypothetical protein
VRRLLRRQAADAAPAAPPPLAHPQPDQSFDTALLTTELTARAHPRLHRRTCVPQRRATLTRRRPSQDKPAPKPPLDSSLQFGRHFSDHMLQARRASAHPGAAICIKRKADPPPVSAGGLDPSPRLGRAAHHAAAALQPAPRRPGTHLSASA